MIAIASTKLLPGAATDGPFGPGLLDVSGITDTVISAINYSLANAAFVENLTLIGAALQATGNSLANTLAGNAGNNLLNGAGGNDTLTGGAGVDTLLGGAGNDTLVWNAADAKFDGGTGTDTLRVPGAGVSLNLAAVPNTKIQNVEVVMITGSGNNSLNLNLQDVLAISTTTDTLRIDGNAGDAVTVVDGNWTDGGVVSGYHVYTLTLSSAILRIDADIASVTITTA